MPYTSNEPLRAAHIALQPCTTTLPLPGPARVQQAPSVRKGNMASRRLLNDEGSLFSVPFADGGLRNPFVLKVEFVRDLFPRFHLMVLRARVALIFVENDYRVSPYTILLGQRV